MIYAPHILQLKVVSEPSTDKYGREFPGIGETAWQDICKCRCDDNSTQKFEEVNGRLYIPKYHVVCEGKIALNAGDYVRILDGDNIRGDGEIYQIKVLNFLNYSELWI